MLIDTLLLAAEAVLYFAILAGIFRLRAMLGLGVFVTALGTLHFLETFLAANLYVLIPGDFATSPGSSILFTGKLMLLLLVYIQEDATSARQPIYGLLAGNFLILALVVLLRAHNVLPLASGSLPDLGFLGSMGWLMVWGTMLLYADSLLLVLLYERLGRHFERHTNARIFCAAALVLTVDQAGFYVGLKLIVGVPLSALYGGWLAKMAAAGIFAALTGFYLAKIEPHRRGRVVEHKLREIFEILTYRERYHALLEQSGRDVLTGAFTRSRLETHGRQAVDLAVASGQSVSVFVMDLDHFKAVNDRHGHAGGDAALRTVASIMLAQAGDADYLFRYGGDEFVLCAAGLGSEAPLRVAEQLAELVRTTAVAGLDEPVSVSIGVATGPVEGPDFAALFALADERLYAAKRLKRGRAASREEASAALTTLPQRRAAA